MSRDPEARSPTVSYNDAEPQFIELSVVRWSGDNRYSDDYKFRMDGSTAVLTSIEPDCGRYNVISTEDCRAAAAEAVEALPFVQAVSLFPEGDE